jgi:hypothetical protein
MSKKQFKKKKTIQIQREIKNHLKNEFIPKILAEIEKMVYDENTEKELLEIDNNDIKNYFLDNYLK